MVAPLIYRSATIIEGAPQFCWGATSIIVSLLLDRGTTIISVAPLYNKGATIIEVAPWYNENATIIKCALLHYINDTNHNTEVARFILKQCNLYSSSFVSIM